MDETCLVFISDPAPQKPLMSPRSRVTLRVSNGAALTFRRVTRQDVLFHLYFSFPFH